MEINLVDYSYNLPFEQIASYPLDKRDDSKLLIYNQGIIEHNQFHSIPQYLPDNSLLVFNNTKVIPARLHFQKDTGAVIEIFLLSPLLPGVLVLEAMQASQTCTWKCAIGNIKRWKEGDSLVKTLKNVTIEASLLDKEAGHIEFKWNTDHNFAEVVSQAGETPLPPYIKRKAEESDRTRYQTIYSQVDGAVAAPTAGLHFTPDVFSVLEKRNIKTDFVTLHVSAGTFQPIKVTNAAEHQMHSEQVVVQRENIESLLKSGFTIPVGTTSMRTLESLFWYGVKLLRDPEALFNISQYDPYFIQGKIPSREEALEATLRHVDKHKLDSITGETSIYILPGYQFQMCQGLITNFHQPGSTLILLVAAFIGEDWKKVYQEALKKNYRFLSYGDSSLLLPKLQKK